MEREVLLTEQEANALIDLLDVAVKSQGLSAAQNALVLVSKLQKAFAESPIENEPLDGEKENNE